MLLYRTICELTNNMWWTELSKPRSILSEMLIVMCRQQAARDAVASNTIIQHSVHHILQYVHASISPPNPPNLRLPTPPHLRISTAMMKRVRCHTLFALKPNVSCTERHSGSSRQSAPPAPPPLHNIQQQSESRMNKHGELRSHLRLSVMWHTSA